MLAASACTRTSIISSVRDDATARRLSSVDGCVSPCQLTETCKHARAGGKIIMAREWKGTLAQT